jgi:endo-1,3(4)-beta-glucanase
MASPKTGVTKYTVLLEDGKTWLLYAYSPSGMELDFTVVNNGLAQATSNFDGIIQIAKNPVVDAEALYDAACGVYPTTATLSGNVNGTTGSYTLSFTKGGMTDNTLLIFALPHHVSSFDATTKAAITTLQLDTTSKGTATAVLADSWTLVEQLPTTLGFAPWAPSTNNKALSATALAAIRTIAASEVSQNMTQQTDLNSMYYSGKVSRWISLCNRLRLTTAGSRQIRRHSLHVTRYCAGASLGTSRTCQSPIGIRVVCLQQPTVSARL